MKNPSDDAAERQATGNRAAFLHWLQAVHGLRLEPHDSQDQAPSDPQEKALRDPLEESLRDPLEEALRDPLEEALRDPLEEALRDPLEEALRDPLEEALRAWAEADPTQAAPLILRFAGDGFASARLAAGLLLQADLRPDDLILTAITGAAPDWLPQALQATQGRTPTEAQATVLVTDAMPQTLPPGIRRVILLGSAQAVAPPGVTLSRSADWTYPRESSAA